MCTLTRTVCTVCTQNILTTHSGNTPTHTHTHTHTGLKHILTPTKRHTLTHTQNACQKQYSTQSSSHTHTVNCLLFFCPHFTLIHLPGNFMRKCNRLCYFYWIFFLSPVGACGWRCYVGLAGKKRLTLCLSNMLCFVSYAQCLRVILYMLYCLILFCH